MNNRIKKLRNALGFTQKEFGEKIGIGPSSITMFENGSRNMSEQTLILICKQFNVSEVWLRTGEGEMFVEIDGTILAALMDEYDLDSLDEKILKTYLELPDDKRDAFKDFILNLVRSLQDTEAETAGEIMPPDFSELNRPLSPAEHAKILRDRADAIEKGVADSTTSGSDIVA